MLNRILRCFYACCSNLKTFEWELVKLLDDNDIDFSETFDISNDINIFETPGIKQFLSNFEKIFF